MTRYITGSVKTKEHANHENYQEAVDWIESRRTADPLGVDNGDYFIYRMEGEKCRSCHHN